MAEYSSTYRGAVVNNLDPAGAGAVLLRVPDVLGSAVSNWAKPSEPSPFVPLVGDVVSVFFESGDPAKPFYLPKAITALNEANAKKVRYETYAPTDEPNNIGDTWFQQDAVTGDTVALWQGLGGTSWQSGQLTHETIASVDLGTATVGYLDGARIAAKTITADKVVIGAGDNILPDPMFKGAIGIAWTGTSGMSITAEGPNGANSMKFANIASQQASYAMPTELIPVAAGDAYRATLSIKTDVAFPSGGVSVGLRVKKSDGSYAYVTASVPAQAAAVANYTTFDLGAVTIPATGTLSIYVASQAAFSSGTLWVSSVTVARAVTGSLIVDGAIDGKTITGATVQTAASGNRIRLLKTTSNKLDFLTDDTGLAAFPSISNGTVGLDGSVNSDLVIRGPIPSAAGSGMGGGLTLNATGAVITSGRAINIGIKSDFGATGLAITDRNGGAKLFAVGGQNYVGSTVELGGVSEIVAGGRQGRLAAATSGYITIGPVAANGGSATATITFPSDVNFAVAPIVTLTPNSGRLNCAVFGITTTSCDIGVNNWTSVAINGNSTIHWIAVAR